MVNPIISSYVLIIYLYIDLFLLLISFFFLFIMMKCFASFVTLLKKVSIYDFFHLFDTIPLTSAQ